MFTKRKNSAVLPLLIIVCLSLAVRILYFQVKPTLSVYPDSYGYYDLGTQMVASPSLSTIITPYKTPLYPFLVGATAFLVGKLGTPIGAPGFAIVGSSILVVQTFIGIATLLLIYLGLSQIDKNKWRALFITLFFTIDPMLLAFERTMLTETVAIFFAVLTMYAMVMLLIKPTYRGFLLLGIASILGFLTRPAFLAIPLAGVPFLLWFFFRKKNRVAMGLVALTTLSYLLVPLIYSRINEFYDGYKGIQYVSDIAMLGRILEFKIPPEAGGEIVYLYDRVKRQQNSGIQRTAFEFIESFDPAFYGDKEKRNLLHTFVLRVVAANKGVYITNALRYIPLMFFDISLETTVPSGSVLPATLFFRLLWNVYHLVQYPTILMIGCFPFLLFWFFKRTTISTTMIAVCSTVVVTQVLVTVGLIYYEDYGRLAMIFRPHLYIPFMYIAQRVCEKGLPFFIKIKKVKKAALQLPELEK